MADWAATRQYSSHSANGLATTAGAMVVNWLTGNLPWDEHKVRLTLRLR